MFTTPTAWNSWYLLKRLNTVLTSYFPRVHNSPIQRCVNFINRAASPAFASPSFRNLMAKYLPTAEKNSITIFFEHIKDQDRYVRSILSDVKLMKTLTTKQQLQHAAATTCELCHDQFTKKNKKTKHHCHLNELYIGSYCNPCNLKFKYKKGPNSYPTDEKKKKTSKKKQSNFFNGTFKNS